MPNRPPNELPALYVEAEPFHALAQSPLGQPCALEIYDVTYLHFHSVLELGLCVEGEGLCYVEDRVDPFRAGDVQVIFPFQRHLSQNTTPRSSRWYWLNVDPMALLRAGGFAQLQQVDEWLCTQMALCGILRPEAHPLIAQTIRRLVQEACQNAKHRLPLCCALLYELVIELCRASEGLPRLRLPRDAQLMRLAPALETVSTCLEQGATVSVQELADLCGMGASTFRRAFQETIGLPPKAYILNCAMRKAQRLLLRTDMSITAISQAVGFEDVSGFNRCFMAKNQVAPSEYRKRHAPQGMPGKTKEEFPW